MMASMISSCVRGLCRNHQTGSIEGLCVVTFRFSSSSKCFPHLAFTCVRLDYCSSIFSFEQSLTLS